MATADRDFVGFHVENGKPDFPVAQGRVRAVVRGEGAGAGGPQYLHITHWEELLQSVSDFIFSKHYGSRGCLKLSFFLSLTH